jgi:hypothetical protein
MCSTKKLKTDGNLKISDCHDTACVDSVDYRELLCKTGQGEDLAQTSQSGSKMSSAVKTLLKKAGNYVWVSWHAPVGGAVRDPTDPDAVEQYNPLRSGQGTRAA